MTPNQDELIKALRRICELQTAYSAKNTEPMQERGRLLRRNLTSAIRALEPSLSKAMGEYGADFHVDSSDGVGRKTELPWVRFCSHKMSPNPREGFYSVIHFSTDGKAVHFTVGCSSSKYSKGSFSALPSKELINRTAWARKVMKEAYGTLEPFTDKADFGATRPLTKSFEKATAISKRVITDDIPNTDIHSLLEKCAEYLRAVYDAENVGRELEPSDQDEIAIERITNPLTKKAGQGFGGLSTEDKRAVEMRAMNVSEDWLKNDGYKVKDTSSNNPYDFLASKNGEEIKVEVKGTTSDQCESILMTRNEVDLHKEEKGKTALFIVYAIRLKGEVGSRTANDGTLDVYLPWDSEGCIFEPTAFRVDLGKNA